MAIDKLGVITGAVRALYVKHPGLWANDVQPNPERSYDVTI